MRMMERCDLPHPGPLPKERENRVPSRTGLRREVGVGQGTGDRKAG